MKRLRRSIGINHESFRKIFTKQTFQGGEYKRLLIFDAETPFSVSLLGLSTALLSIYFQSLKIYFVLP